MNRAKASQWSRTALAMAALLASLPVACRIFVGSWGFDGAIEAACLCLVVGAYFHIQSRGNFPVLPDSATILDRAIELGASGHVEEATGLLTEALRLSPRLWQAWQYRGEMSLAQGDAAAAVRDFSAAIALAPREPYLYALRAQAHHVYGESADAQADYEAAVALAGEAGAAVVPGDSSAGETVQ
jgi:tetratricopeptide (TPR) repeat protein